MQKRGQFYLISTIIIVTLISSILFISNYSNQKTENQFDFLKEELVSESTKVIDYGIKNNQDIQTLLKNFTEDYSNYSQAEDSYFLFGDRSEITLAGLKKESSGNVVINFGAGNEELFLSPGIYNSKDFSNPNDTIEITLEERKYDFTLKSGENFYFILSKKIGDEKYIVTN